MRKVIVTAALTGGFGTKAEIPNLPITPEEIARSARESYEAGAAVVHVHLRDGQGRSTADLGIARRTVDAVREECPEVIINLSTGVSDTVPFEERMKLVEILTPIMSLDICSMTFGDSQMINPPMLVRKQAARMLELGIKPELELFDVGHLYFALQLLSEGLLEPPLLVSLVFGKLGGMPADAGILATLVKELPPDAAWQVIAVAQHHTPMTTIGLAMGGNARTGFEDTRMIERGRIASSNGELVERLVQVTRLLQREPMKAAEVPTALGLAI
ncbi:MAG: 3-keto-5-aminohexanoate cleavage protein [Actinobacteria bacterium]|nr:3-keto-5-aminohexanoate cleavage protein [Actinomycetota bacterium]